MPRSISCEFSDSTVTVTCGKRAMNGAVSCETIGSAVGIAPSRSRPERPLSISSMSLAHDLGFGEDAMGVLQRELALPGQADEAMAALDDRRAEILFELANRRRKGRLRHVARRRGAAEMLFARQRHEIFQLPQHHGAQSSRRRGGGDSPSLSIAAAAARRYGGARPTMEERSLSPAKSRREIARLRVPRRARSPSPSP